MRYRLLVVVAVCLSCIALTGCGQKGPLRLPPEPAKPNQNVTSTAVEAPQQIHQPHPHTAQ